MTTSDNYHIFILVTEKLHSKTEEKDGWVEKFPGCRQREVPERETTLTEQILGKELDRVFEGMPLVRQVMGEALGID